MDTVITLVAAPIVLLVGILAASRRPASRSGFGAVQVTRRKRPWSVEPAAAERAVERLRG